MDSTYTNLSPISKTFLSIDTFLSDDVYNHAATRLLANAGTFLTEEQMLQIHNLNQAKDIIHVTSAMYQELIEEHTNARRMKLEEITGYTLAKDKTVGLLNTIMHNKTLDQDSLSNISNTLAVKIKSIPSSTIVSLVNALAPVDEYLHRHCINTGLFNGLMAQWLDLPKEALDHLIMIGLLHDCGKALVPSGILAAPRKLSIAEYQVIKMHPIHGYNLTADMPLNVRRAVRGHHEKYDGSGYPDGLRHNNIPIEARITAISDIYDAMVSQRAYKTSQSPFHVMRLLQSLAETELDTNLVALLVNNMPRSFIGKKAMLSDGRIGTVRTFDPGNIEYPVLEVHDRLVKTNEHLFCTAMLD